MLATAVAVLQRRSACKPTPPWAGRGVLNHGPSVGEVTGLSIVAGIYGSRRFDALRPRRPLVQERSIARAIGGAARMDRPGRERHRFLGCIDGRRCALEVHLWIGTSLPALIVSSSCLRDAGKHRAYPVVAYGGSRVEVQPELVHVPEHQVHVGASGESPFRRHDGTPERSYATPAAMSHTFRS